MNNAIVLASSSQIRKEILANAGLDVTVVAKRLDETAIKTSLLAEQTTPADIASTLAEHKSMRVTNRHLGQLVLGCDQVLTLDGALFNKPVDLADARNQLMRLRGKRHELLSAAVICLDSQPIWRHVASAHLTMRDVSDSWIDAYLTRAWPGVSQSVGAYKVEEEGIRLFSKIEGDYFTILGLPLLPILNFLYERGELTP